MFLKKIRRTLDIQDELRRVRERDPWQLLRMQPKQLELLKAAGNREIKFIIAATGNQFGKTTWMCYDIGSFTQCRHPYLKTPRNAVSWISVTDYKKFEEVLLPKFKDILRPETYKTNKAEWYIEIIAGPGKGNRIFFKSQEQGIAGYEGAVIHRLGIDEEHIEEIMQAAIIRTMKMNGQVLVSATLFKGLTWLYDVYIEPVFRNGKEKNMVWYQGNTCVATGSPYENEANDPKAVAELERQVRLKDDLQADIRFRGLFRDLSGASIFKGMALQYFEDNALQETRAEIVA